MDFYFEVIFWFNRWKVFDIILIGFFDMCYMGDVVEVVFVVFVFDWGVVEEDGFFVINKVLDWVFGN